MFTSIYISHSMNTNFKNLQHIQKKREQSTHAQLEIFHPVYLTYENDLNYNLWYIHVRKSVVSLKAVNEEW